MNISPHLLIDTVILSAALTITLVLRAKGNATREEKENKWLLNQKKKNLKKLNYIAIGVILVYLYSAFVVINKWLTCTA